MEEKLNVIIGMAKLIIKEMLAPYYSKRKDLINSQRNLKDKAKKRSYSR
jgi:hypothetical protein